MDYASERSVYTLESVFLMCWKCSCHFLCLRDREIQLYELSSLEPYCQINSLETMPLKLDYWWEHFQKHRLHEIIFWKIQAKTQIKRLLKYPIRKYTQPHFVKLLCIILCVLLVKPYNFCEIRDFIPISLQLYWPWWMCYHIWWYSGKHIPDEYTFRQMSSGRWVHGISLINYVAFFILGLCEYHTNDICGGDTKVNTYINDLHLAHACF